MMFGLYDYVSANMPVNHPNAYNPVKSYISKCRGGTSGTHGEGAMIFWITDLLLCANLYHTIERISRSTCMGGTRVVHTRGAMIFCITTDADVRQFLRHNQRCAAHQQPLNFANITFHIQASTSHSSIPLWEFVHSTMPLLGLRMKCYVGGIHSQPTYTSHSSKLWEFVHSTMPLLELRMKC